LQQSVSVIIPAFNAAVTIAQCLDSVLAQTRPPAEIIVVDDGSRDDSCQIIAGYGAKVRLIKQPNGGPAAARNSGARLARGDWLAMLDADDWWAPTKLAKQMTLADPPEVGLIHTLVNNSRPGVPPELDFDQLWRVNWIINSSVLIRTAAFEQIGGCVEDRALIGVEDYNLWLRLAAKGWRLLNYPEVLTHYKRGGGLSANIARNLAGELENLRLLSNQLGLSEQSCRVKRASIYQQAGRSAFHQRDAELARAAHLQAYRLQPSLSRAAHLLAAHVPLAVADARREALRRQPPAAAVSAAGIAEQSILGRHQLAPIDFGTGAPYLLVIIDAEEEFDWTAIPFASRGVTAMRHQDVAQRLFQRHNIIPTFAVDYAVAAQADGYEPLRDYLADGLCEIGAQLHPWVNPPIIEALIPRNSFPGNLPASLESAKLCMLTAKIEETLGCRPRLYRAGRYGVGAHSARMLDALGYQIDCSVVPFHNYLPDGGPDFRASDNRPFWFGPGNRLLEIPVTVGMTGGLARSGRQIYPLIDQPIGKRMHLPGIMARLSLLDRVRLTPEGVSLVEAKKLTRSLLQRDGQRVFVLSYHSPSLQAGNTPYVRNRRDLDRFMGWLEDYLAFFFGELGGMAATPSCIYAEAAFAAHPERLLATNSEFSTHLAVSGGAT
jgi:glycosyltransferase involved in cell wall biosynthesis